MIITRTPFRYTLGGGGTDLPSYYSRFGGFVFASAIDKYMYIAVNRPIVDDLVRLKYSGSETVENTDGLQHELAREVLRVMNIPDAIEVISMADIPAGTGLGSSSCYVVGLLTALSNLKRDQRPVAEIAELACHIEMERLGKPVGKQDQYLAAFGGLPVLEIAKDGKVSVRQARVSADVQDELCRNTLMFYTGTTRSADSILKHQDQSVKKSDAQVTDSLHRIKEIGREILEELEAGNVDAFGELTHAHWLVKQRLSNKIANPRHLEIYERAREAGALGGKITGAGGGGFFVFYVPKNHSEFRKAMTAEGLRELRYHFDVEGSKSLINLADGRTQHDPFQPPYWEQSRDDLGIPGTRGESHPSV